MTTYTVTRHKLANSGNAPATYAGQSKVEADNINQAVEIVRAQLRANGRNPNDYMLEADLWADPDQYEDWLES